MEQIHPSTSQEQAEHPRPKREAALKARQLIKQWCAENLVDQESVVGSHVEGSQKPGKTYHDRGGGGGGSRRI